MRGRKDKQEDICWGDMGRTSWKKYLCPYFVVDVVPLLQNLRDVVLHKSDGQIKHPKTESSSSFGILKQMHSIYHHIPIKQSEAFEKSDWLWLCKR